MASASRAMVEAHALIYWLKKGLDNRIPRME